MALSETSSTRIVHATFLVAWTASSGWRGPLGMRLSTLNEGCVCIGNIYLPTYGDALEDNLQDDV